MISRWVLKRWRFYKKTSVESSPFRTTSRKQRLRTMLVTSAIKILLPQKCTWTHSLHSCVKCWASRIHQVFFSGKKADLSFDMSSIKDQNPDEIDVGEDSDDVIDDLIDTSDVIDTSDMEEPTWARTNSRRRHFNCKSSWNFNWAMMTRQTEVVTQMAGNAYHSRIFYLQLNSPLQLPPPRLSGGLSLPKPVCTSSESSETAETKDAEIAQTNEPISAVNVDTKLKSDTIKTLDESPVPPVKKFKRRNQSMYESTDDE